MIKIEKINIRRVTVFKYGASRLIKLLGIRNMSGVNELVLDLSQVDSESTIFDFLIKQFNFPDLYCRNWEGMEQHVFYDPMCRVPKMLIVLNTDTFKSSYPSVFVKLYGWFKCFPKGTVVYS
jgi:hypothetical protein